MRKPRISRYVFLCRTGFEAFLHQELARAGLKPSPLGPGSVECEPGDFIPVFGRAGFRVVEGPGPTGTLEAWAADAVALPALPAPLEKGPQRYVVCALAPDVT